MSELHLVTGASGVLGRALVDALLKTGARVRALDLVFDADFPSQADQVVGDVREESVLKVAVAGCAVVHHLAARMPQWGFLGEKGFREINVDATHALLAAATSAGARRFVFASSTEVDGPQEKYPLHEDDEKVFTGTYSRNKFECEQILGEWVDAHDIEVVSLRMPMIFGASFFHERSMLLLFDMVRRGWPVAMVANVAAPFCCVSARDAAQGFVLAAQVPDISGQAYNLCCEQAPTIKEAMREFLQRVGSRSCLVPIPLALVRTFIGLWRKTNWSLPLLKTPAELLPFSLTGGHYSIERAQTELGFAPKDSPVDCLCMGYQWYSSHRERSFELRERSGL